MYIRYTYVSGIGVCKPNSFSLGAPPLLSWLWSVPPPCIPVQLNRFKSVQNSQGAPRSPNTPLCSRSLRSSHGTMVTGHLPTIRIHFHPFAYWYVKVRFPSHDQLNVFRNIQKFDAVAAHPLASVHLKTASPENPNHQLPGAMGPHAAVPEFATLRTAPRGRLQEIIQHPRMPSTNPKFIAKTIQYMWL